MRGRVRSIVIVGAGAAGLSVAYYLSTLNQQIDFTCTLIDPDTKEENDRTWAFWGGPFEFDHLVKKRWNYVDILTSQRRVRRESAGYRFIPADRFYAACLDRIRNDSRFTFLRARAERIESEADRCTVTYRSFDGAAGALQSSEQRTLSADYVVDSVFGSGLRVSGEAYDRARAHLRQSFVGWEVQTRVAQWDCDVATLMDFSERGSDFALEFHYVLPDSPTRALCEYTTVDEEVPDQDYLEEQLERYLDSTIGAGGWSIVRREKGTIPLFERTEPVFDGRVVYAGVSSGAARPSTGYAFRSIVEQAKDIAETLAATPGTDRAGTRGVQRLPHARSRPRFYDRVFLELLRRDSSVMPGALCSMFAGNSGERVFRFLAGRSTLADEARIVWSLPWPPFLRALARLGGVRRAHSRQAAPAMHSNVGNS